MSVGVETGFARFDFGLASTALPGGLAVLMVGIVSRQAASPTARQQARLAGSGKACGLLCPQTGAFSADAAQWLADASEETGK